MNTIQVKYSIENLISRTFGLFPYYTYDGGMPTIHRATDSSTGCYEKIVPNLKLPVDFVADETVFIEHGKTYTYRYLADLYSEYKYTQKESEFIKLFDRLVGVIEVDAESIGLGNHIKYPNVPETIYLSRVRSFISMLNELKRSDELSRSSGYTDCDTCRNKATYESYGGDVFVQYLHTLVGVADEIANFGMGLVSDNELEVMFDVPLFQSNFYLGVLDAYTNKWVAGERYYCGDIVTYNGVTYVCVLNQIVQSPCDEFYFLDDYVENQYYNNSGTQCQYVMCGDVFYALDGETNQYVEETVHHIDCMELYMACVSVLYEYVECNGVYYHLDEGHYNVINVCEYTTGVYDEATHSIGFDYAHFMPLTECEQDNEWYSSSNTYGTKYRIFVDVNYMPSEFVYDYIRFLGNFYVWNGSSYVLDQNNCGIYKLQGTNASVLKQFMAKDSFFGAGNDMIVPDFGNDFLYFYKKGKVANRLGQTKYDENGNISRYTLSPVFPGTMVTDLYAYGDVLYDIIPIPDERRIEFRYVIGAHLKAICTDIQLNELLEVLYFFDGEFQYDEDDTHGIRYVESYAYDSGSDIEGLVNDGNFEYYITNYNSDIIVKDSQTNLYITQGVDMTFVMSTQELASQTTPYVLMPGSETEIGDIYKWDGSSYVDYSNDITVYNYTGKPMLFHTTDDDVKTVEVGYGCRSYDYTFINSEYDEDVVNELDLIYSPLYKNDYLNGIAYANSAKGGVDVGRGNAAALERHIKLGDCRTFEDLENFSNGGFFNVVKY